MEEAAVSDFINQLKQLASKVTESPERFDELKKLIDGNFGQEKSNKNISNQGIVELARLLFELSSEHMRTHQYLSKTAVSMVLRSIELLNSTNKLRIISTLSSQCYDYMGDFIQLLFFQYVCNQGITDLLVEFMLTFNRLECYKSTNSHDISHAIHLTLQSEQSLGFKFVESYYCSLIKLHEGVDWRKEIEEQISTNSAIVIQKMINCGLKSSIFCFSAKRSLLAVLKSEATKKLLIKSLQKCAPNSILEVLRESLISLKLDEINLIFSPELMKVVYESLSHQKLCFFIKNLNPEEIRKFTIISTCFYKEFEISLGFVKEILSLFGSCHVLEAVFNSKQISSLVTFVVSTLQHIPIEMLELQRNDLVLCVIKSLDNFLKTIDNAIKQLGMAMSESVMNLVQSADCPRLDFKISFDQFVQETVNNALKKYDSKVQSVPNHISPPSVDVDSDDEEPEGDQNFESGDPSVEGTTIPRYLRDCLHGIKSKSDDRNVFSSCLLNCEKLVRTHSIELSYLYYDLFQTLLHQTKVKYIQNFANLRLNSLVAIAASVPEKIFPFILEQFYSKHSSIPIRLELLQIYELASLEISQRKVKDVQRKNNSSFYLTREDESYFEESKSTLPPFSSDSCYSWPFISEIFIKFVSNHNNLLKHQEDHFQTCIILVSFIKSLSHILLMFKSNPTMNEAVLCFLEFVLKLTNHEIPSVVDASVQAILHGLLFLTFQPHLIIENTKNVTNIKLFLKSIFLIYRQLSFTEKL